MKDIVCEGRFIKHTRTMDACFLITSVDYYYAYNELVVTGEWYNLGYEKSWGTGEVQEIKLTIDRLRDAWLVCTEPQQCLRKSKWVPIKDVK